MKHLNRAVSMRSVVLVLLAVVAAGIWAPDAAAQEDDRLLRVYTARFLHPNNVAALAFQVCGDEERCEIESMGNQGIVVRAPDVVHAEFAALLAERDVPPPTQEFRVILLRADRGNGMPELPDDATAALQDLRDMTAYSGFEMLDSAWLRTSGEGSTSLGEAGSFVVELRFTGDPRQGASLLVEGFALYHAPVHWFEDDDGMRRAALGDLKQVLSSQFGIDVGETVVVGTSRLNGGEEALVVLLTALGR